MLFAQSFHYGSFLNDLIENPGSGEKTAVLLQDVLTAEITTAATSSLSRISVAKKNKPVKKTLRQLGANVNELIVSYKPSQVDVFQDVNKKPLKPLLLRDLISMFVHARKPKARFAPPRAACTLPSFT